MILKKNSGARKSKFCLPRLAVQHNHQSEVAVHFIYHCKMNSFYVRIGSVALQK